MKDELIKKLDEYIEFLGEELNELAVLANVHGWKSTRVEQGFEKRKEISEIKKAINNETETNNCDTTAGV